MLPVRQRFKTHPAVAQHGEAKPLIQPEDVTRALEVRQGTKRLSDFKPEERPAIARALQSEGHMSAQARRQQPLRRKAFIRKHQMRKLRP